MARPGSHGAVQRGRRLRHAPRLSAGGYTFRFRNEPTPHGRGNRRCEGEVGEAVRRVKRAALTAAQILITIAIVWWVFRDPAKRAEMAATLLRADAQWLLLGLAAYGVVELISATRWQILLRVQGFQLSFRRVLALTMIGVFFNFFIPGGTGGDAVKMFYLVQETPGRKGTAILSVIVDRLIGLFALVVFAGILIGFKWNWLHSAPEV